MSIDEFLEQFKEGCMLVRCQTSEERQEVIRFLVNHGIPHGESGVSREMLNDVNKYRDRFLIVKRAYNGDGIEFYSGFHNSVQYSTIAHLFCPRGPQVDDLL